MSRWLTLQEYSNKYKMSVSTLRRRIKREEIKYIFENGKYFLQDSRENLQIKEKDFASFKELQSLYKDLLVQKDKEISKLKMEKEDLKELVLLLEKEKTDLEEFLKKSSILTPKPPLL